MLLAICVSTTYTKTNRSRSFSSYGRFQAVEAEGWSWHISVEQQKQLVCGLQIVPVKEVLHGASLDRNGSLTQQVHRLVRSLAVSRVLLPNQFLSEKDVAAALDIGKTPVRDHVELLHFLHRKRPGTRRSRADKEGKA